MARGPSLRRPSRPGLLRRLVGVVAVLLVLLLAGLAIGARHVLPGALERLAALRGVPLQVGGAEVAWVQGRVTLLDVRLGDLDVPPLAWEAVELGWAWRTVLTGRLELDRFQLRGARLDLGALSTPGGGVDTLAAWLATLDGLELGPTPVPWLSAAVGVEAQVERAGCEALARLAAGEEGECQLALRVGAAPVRAVIRLQVDGESMRYDARLDADALELERWQALLLPEQAHPLTRAAADVRARIAGSYAPGEGLVDGSGDVTMGVSELSGTAPGAAIEAGGIVWRGSLDAGWSSSLGLVVARARGELEAARVAVSTAPGPGSVALEAAGVVWRGGVDFAGAAPVLEGGLQAERMTLAPASRQWQVEVAGLAARGGFQGDAASASLDSLSARVLEVDGPVFGVARGFVLEGLALEGVGRDAGGAWQTARLAARSLVSTGTLPGPDGEEPVARLPALAAVGVTLGAGGRVEALRFEASRLELNLGAFDAALERVVADELVAGPQEGLLARSLSADRLEEVGAGHRMVYEELVAEAVTLIPGGAGSAREKRVARATIEFDDAGTWTLEDVRSYALRWTVAGTSSVDEVSVDALAFTDSSLGRGRLDSLVLRTLTASEDARLAAEEAHAAAIAVDTSRAGRWRARELRFTGPRLDPGERLETRRIQLDELSARGVAGFDWTLEGLAIDGLDGNALTHFDAQALAFTSTRFTSASVDSQLEGLSARGVRWRPGARLLVEAGTLEQSTIRSQGRTISGTGYRAEDGAWALPLDFEAATMSLERLGGVEPDGLEWSVEQLDAEGFRFEELQVYGAFAADAARGAAVTIEVPPSASARFDAPEVEGFRWLLGELPALATGRIGASGGRADPVEWRIGSTLIAGRGADRAFESMVVRDLYLFDTQNRVDFAADSLRMANGQVPRWPIIEAEAFELDGLRIGRVDGEGLGQLTVDWTRGTDGRVALGEALEFGEVMMTDLDVMGGVDAQGRRMWPVLDPRRVGLQPSRVRIGRLATEGGASISYVDNSVTPPVDFHIEPINAVLRGFDTTRPDRPGEFEIRAVGDSAGSVTARGLVTPSFQTLDVDAEISARGIDLKDLSPWAVRTHGTRITGGRLDLDVDLRVEARSVSGNAKVLIDSLDFAPPEHEGRPGTFGDEARRLDGSLALLEDSNRRIHLEAPFSGNLDDKEFRFSQVMAQALANTATTTVMLALKPIGLIADEIFRGSRFPPLAFEPGEVSLSATDLVLLEDLSRTLETRPRMQIRLCGKAGPKDREAIERAFSHPGRLPVVLGGAGVTPSFTASGLARRRADSAREWLLGTGRVQAAQLPLCAPEVEQDPAAAPRVEVVLAHAPPERPAPPPSREKREELAR